ncbi:MAG: uracil phosphoribosyltransferase [Eubacteriaceae bacterium]|nr:uracil phosphoribosyltransferase [Eubacteriaceae bacterium]
MKKVHLIEHPLIVHKLTMLRDKHTQSKDFREIVREMSLLMAYEVTKDFPLKEIEIETPLATTRQKVMSEKNVVIVPILRAGLGMVDGFLSIMPNAKTGHIGLYRDPKTHLPVEYYKKLPMDVLDREVILVDPMLATGVSIVAALNKLKEAGCKDIKLVVILACTEGLEAIHKVHPDVEIYCAGIDEVLNENKYIVPGLGDAGDRLFGTK